MKEEEVEHQRHQYFNLDEPDVAPYIKPTFEEEYVGETREKAATPEKRRWFRLNKGWLASDLEILKAWEEDRNPIVRKVNFDFDTWADRVNHTIDEMVVEKVTASNIKAEQKKWDKIVKEDIQQGLKRGWENVSKNGLMPGIVVEPVTEKQIGGDHYKNMAITPTEYIVANDIRWSEGNVIKYISRHEAKNGRQDVEKALHYCELILKGYDEAERLESLTN